MDLVLGMTRETKSSSKNVGVYVTRNARRTFLGGYTKRPAFPEHMVNCVEKQQEEHWGNPVSFPELISLSNYI